MLFLRLQKLLFSLSSMLFGLLYAVKSRCLIERNKKTHAHTRNDHPRWTLDEHFFVLLLQCNAAVGVKAFFDMMHSGPHKVMLFGAACTHVTDPIAKASKHWRLTQVSWKHWLGAPIRVGIVPRMCDSESKFSRTVSRRASRDNWTTPRWNEPFTPENALSFPCVLLVYGRKSVLAREFFGEFRWNWENRETSLSASLPGICLSMPFANLSIRFQWIRSTNFFYEPSLNEKFGIKSKVTANWRAISLSILD